MLTDHGSTMTDLPTAPTPELLAFQKALAGRGRGARVDPVGAPLYAGWHRNGGEPDDGIEGGQGAGG